LLLLTAATSAANRPSPQDRPASLYFLAIGAEEYDFLPSNKVSPVRAPRNSAKRVADLLLKLGAKDGILLTGNPDQQGSSYVTREDVADAITELKRRIRQDRPAAPRIVVYFMGHGIGDEVGRYLYMLPENFGLAEARSARQTTTLRLIKSTIWNFDLVSALVNFRMHPSMVHFDDFLPSQIMPDMSDRKDAVEAIRRSQELVEIDEERRATNAYAAEGNAPVPYLVLFDNCYGGLTKDLIGSAPRFGALVDSMVSDLETDGIVLYAARPGDVVWDYYDPEAAPDQDDARNDRLGPLAYRLVLAAKSLDRSASITLPGLVKQMRNVHALSKQPSDLRGEKAPVQIPEPYSVSRLDDDVARVEFLPTSSIGGPARYQTIYGSGSEVAACCDR